MPPELEERPGIAWLYACMNAGLSIEDLRNMRIDQAEAIIELQEFIHDAARRETDGTKRRESSKKSEAAFWG